MTAARCLGVKVGVGATPVQWTEVASRVAQRALDVRATAQCPGARVRLYNSRLATIFLRRRRFAKLDGLIVRRMRQAVEGLTRAPWMALPPVVLQRAKGWGLDVEVRDHHADDLAAGVCLAK